MPRWLVYYVVGNWISQWRNDLDIWENKVHLRKPLLVKGDGPIHKARRWFRQFYPEGTVPTGDDDLEHAAQ
jgi:cholesterol 7-dehydrogenase